MNVCSIGEILWNCFPGKEFLGGAPVNFATNMRRLGDRSIMISAVGNDSPGKCALGAMRAIGIQLDYVSVVTDLPTGVARVALPSNGEPTFEIVRPSAYDRIVLSQQQYALIRQSEIDWLYFGTLANMSKQVEELTAQLSHGLPQACCLYDMNLRQNNWNINLVRRLCRLATVLKLNESEARVVSGLNGNTSAQFSLETFCSTWAAEYGIDTICVTLGGRGCAIYNKGIFATYSTASVQVVDTVGAGDAFAAGFLHGYHRGWAIAKTAGFANTMGAIVASRAGATPPFTLEECTAIAFSARS